MSEPYCQAADLLIGDIGGLDPEKDRYIQLATDEMDSYIGYVYVIPLGGVSEHIALVLKGICQKMASGWLLLAQAAGNEDTVVHAYGRYLLEEAYRDLWAIRNGTLDLGMPKVGTASSGDAPAIIQGDLTSGVDAFYDWMNDPAAECFLGPIWRPGPNG